MDQPDLLTPELNAAAVSTPSVYDLLRKRHEGNEWVLLEEVALATGGGTRYADAIAINLWASRGHAIIGFEVKTARSDWLRELKQPEKAEPVIKFCDHWNIVAPKGIVKDGELPPNWGLLEVRGSALVQAVPAKRLDPAPVTRAFFASLVRRAFEQVDRRAVALVAGELKAARKREDETVQRRVKDETREVRRQIEAITKFTEATGLAMDPWGGPPIATIKLAQKLEALSQYDREQLFGRVLSMAGDMERLAASIRAALGDTDSTTADQPHRKTT
jgi:hypothetical protein